MPLYWVNGKQTIRAHSLIQCAGVHCPLHRPSDHNMRDFALYWRQDTMIFERICTHGIGHPDPDTMSWIATHSPEHAWARGVHGCDGCCLDERPRERTIV